MPRVKVRRNSRLEVDVKLLETVDYDPEDLEHLIDLSPQSSVFSYIDDLNRSSSPARGPPTTPSISMPALRSDPHAHSQPKPLDPSIRLLFSHLSRRQRISLLCPAILTSILSGGIAPFMTYVVGQSFAAFAEFSLTANPPQEAKDKLLSGVGRAALDLLGLAAGSLLLGSATSFLWILIGESNVMAVRKKVYAAVTSKEMAWFDTKMGSEGTVQSANGESGPIGAGGLMAKFTRETDEVRLASSLASGTILQNLTTCISCLILAFVRSWALTLVILSAVPVLVIIQAISQRIAGPLLATERAQTASAATVIDRTITAISTVKAFNAASYEESTLSKKFETMRLATGNLDALWGMTSTMMQFFFMAMFVQGFWFGAKLVREGKVGAGDVMAVFWACLIATSNLQMCIPKIIILSKGTSSMVALLQLVDGGAAPGPTSPSSYDSNPKFLQKYSKNRPLRLRKIVPARCRGGFALHNITFFYPSRPNIAVLQDVTLYLPANEMSFIVGSSGSGKSTIAQLLLRMYKPQEGVVYLDDRDLRYLDEQWTRQHVAAVSQNVVLFDMSVHDNVAMGIVDGRSEEGEDRSKPRKPEDVTREEVVEACRFALMHEFVKGLPDGYETMLGTGGAALSGGQKQRLAIARAELRNPTILILDEATSALDATSRILVFEAIKRRRVNKTTIVITHDLSQITSRDFVCVLKMGRVVEQGYRSDLERTRGEFRDMVEVQQQTGGYLPGKDLDDEERKEAANEAVEMKCGGDEEEEGAEQGANLPMLMKLSNWIFDVVADLASNTGPSREAYTFELILSEGSKEEAQPRRRRRLNLQIDQLPTPAPARSRQSSLRVTPRGPRGPRGPRLAINKRKPIYMAEIDLDLEEESPALVRNGMIAATSRRRKLMMSGNTHTVKVENPSADQQKQKPQKSSRSLFQTIALIFPDIPSKLLLFLGLAISVCSGCMTPIFSFLLSRLLYEVSIGAQNTSVINQFGGIVLSIAALDGIFLGLKMFLMETCAISWITSIRKTAFHRVIRQDKKWFDKSENAPANVVQVMVKDGDDAKGLVAVVMGQCFVVISMLSVGLLWALVNGWQLTLIGFAIAPVFGGTMVIQSRLVERCEIRNKSAREDIAKRYYEPISNIRGIRAMGFDSIFQKRFDSAADTALSTGVRGAFVEGSTYGVASSLIYAAEALLFYVGAVLISRGTYTYLRMVEVLNLVVFTVTISSQLMTFTEGIAKSVQATNDLYNLFSISLDTDESQGILQRPIKGDIAFNHVQFSYPNRPEAPVLRDVNMIISEGECVAVVGASGSGKSTIAALLQRLYEPTSGTITIGHNLLHSMDTEYLRKHISVVSQNPTLFNATISENISYGDESISKEVIENAAKAANVHDFIMTLPDGYSTLVGENASLISRGQAQRLSIARALARRANILILDEFTSALDAANQAAVMEMIKEAKKGRTTILATHNLEVMKMCDRILVLGDGEVKEQGTYEELIEQQGVLATLASGGECVGG